jgi:HD-like signal output (HDOD) protein
LKTVNSPFYGLIDKLSTVQQAIDLLGLVMLSRTISELVLKQMSLTRDRLSMERFWDSSGKLASAAAVLALRLRVPEINREAAYTYGLFQNCGIPVLMQRFPDYKQTLALANQSADRMFTAIEDERHGANHATTGYLLTKSWHLTATISHAIRYHHDYSVFSAPEGTHPPEALKLIALGMLADYAVQTVFGQNFSLEWQKGGAAALAHLGLDAQRFDEILAEDRALFV